MLRRKKIKLIVERRFLGDLWDQSKVDMENGRETIGIVRGYLKKIERSDEKYFRYHIISADKVQSGLSEKEIEKKYECLAPLVAGEVEVENTLPHLNNNTGIYHTHPLVTSLKYKGERFPPRKFGLPARFSWPDEVNSEKITEKLRKARNNKFCLLLFCVSTCYAEAKVVWDILFELILPKYTSIKTPVEIKMETFEKDVSHGILNYGLSTFFMGECLKSFYEAVTRKDYRKVIEAANHFLKTLKEKGYANQTKLTASDISTLYEWVSNPILWKIAKEDAINVGNIASFKLVLADAKSQHLLYQFPLYDQISDKKLGFRLYPIGIEYSGNIASSREIVKFKQTYKKSLKRSLEELQVRLKKAMVLY